MSNATVVTVTVNALPAAPTIANDTICAGTMSTLMTGTAVNWYSDAAGTMLLTTSSSYTTGMLNADTMIFATITDANGCESTVDTVMITVNPAPVAPTVANDTICAGSGASLTATTSGGTINWYSDPAGTNLVNTGTTYNIPFLNQTTSYYIREIDAITGCEGAWTIATVVVNPQPLAPSAADIEICSGSDVILTATGSGTGDLVFYDVSNTEVGRFTMSAGNTTGTFNAGALAIGNYVYYVAEDNGDCSSALTAINVEVKQLPVAPTALNDSPVCEGEIVFVQASTVAGAVYNWTGPNGFSSSLQNFSLTNITTAEAGVYTVNVSIDGCVSANGSTTVTVNPAPVFTGSITSNSPLCEYETLNLAAPTASGNIAYLWTGPLGFTATGQNISIPTVSETDNQGFYNVSVIDGVTGCTSAPLSTLVMITSLPDGGMASNNSPVCDGANATLSVQEVFGATYNWSGPNGFSSTDREAIVSVSNIDTGLYTVTVTVNSCSSTYDTYVSMYPKPTIIASPDTTIEVNQSLQLFATGAVQYRWTPGDYLDFTTIFNPVMTPDMIGSYTYTVIGTSIYGCDNSEEVEVTVVPEVIDPADVRIVDLFTPNGDGINDTWIVDYLQQASIGNYTLQVITRAGLEVLNTQNYSNDWDGTYNGQPLPDGTYWYIITQDDGTVLKGAVTMKR
jgi:gliding motility-associated-like protein